MALANPWHRRAVASGVDVRAQGGGSPVFARLDLGPAVSAMTGAENEHEPTAVDRRFVRRVIYVVAVVSLVLVAASAVAYAVDVLLLLFAGCVLARFLVGLSRELMEFSKLPYGVSLLIVSIGLTGRRESPLAGGRRPLGVAARPLARRE
jgi:hypothetical protein